MVVRKLITFTLLLIVVKQTVQLNSTESDILSRKKRYLIFPEGSSFQLVLCLTVPTIGIQSVWEFGWTAAMAWELPSKPYFNIKKAHDDAQNKVFAAHNKTASTKENNTQPPKKTVLSYSTIKDLFHTPLYTKVFNPTKQKGVYYKPQPDEELNPFSSPKYRKSQESASLHPMYKEVHRRTRRDLFSRIEGFFVAQQKDGRTCLLKLICEVSQIPSNRKGPFIEEIIKTIFRVKPYINKDSFSNEYSEAASHNRNCNHEYPKCSLSVWNIF